MNCPKCSIKMLEMENEYGCRAVGCNEVVAKHRDSELHCTDQSCQERHIMCFTASMAHGVQGTPESYRRHLTLKERARADKDEYKASITANKMSNLTPKGRLIHSHLGKFIDRLGDVGVDISYFPHEAQLEMIAFADELSDLTDTP